MTLPVNARVEAAPNFIANLAAAHAFFVLQDEESAALRLSKLKAELREMTSVLSWSPGSGFQTLDIPRRKSESAAGVSCRRRKSPFYCDGTLVSGSSVLRL